MLLFDHRGKASSFSSVQLLFGGVFYVQHLLPLDGHVFREGHGQIAWGKTQLRNIGYYHGYKGYRFIAQSQNRIFFTDFNQIIALNQFDMELKTLFYPLIMFSETALKNYVLEVVLSEGNSHHFNEIYSRLLTGYKKYQKGSSRYRKAYRRRLILHDTIYGALTEAYGNNKAIVQHFFHSDLNVPIWAIFEVITLGQFGLFVSCLNESVRKKITANLGFHGGCDSGGRLTEQVIFTIRDLRNSVAHNDVIFDTRFKSGEIAASLKNCLAIETGVKNITFNTITDYLILLVYVLRSLDVTRTDCKRQIKQFEGIIEKGRRQLPYAIFSRVVYGDTAKKIKQLRNYCTG